LVIFIIHKTIIAKREENGYPAKKGSGGLIFGELGEFRGLGVLE